MTEINIEVLNLNISGVNTAIVIPISVQSRDPSILTFKINVSSIFFLKLRIT
jgi:hypothetical protein